jgi:MscS family membrane protein
VSFCEGIRELIRSHPFTRKDSFHVYLNKFSPSSLDILLYIFFKVPDWSVELRERERLMLDILRLADQLGVEIAFPTQTLHLHQHEGMPPPAQHPVPSSSSDDNASHVGINAAQKIVKDQAWQQNKPGAVTFPEGSTSETSDS